MTQGSACFFTDSTIVGGAEIAMARLMLALDQERWSPVLLHHGAAHLAPLLTDLDKAGIRLARVPPMPEPYGLSALPHFVRTIRSLRPAVFHAHLGWPRACKYGIIGALVAQVPCVVATVHSFSNPPMTRLSAWEWRIMSYLVDCFVVSSRFGARQLASINPFAASKIEFIPNGIDVTSYQRDLKWAPKKALVDAYPRRVVLVLARLDPLKGHAHLLEACRDMSDVQIVFAGEGPEEAVLRRLAARLEIDDRVTFLGFREDVPNLLAACDLLVLPSLHEAFGLSLLEAMVAARPIVATRVGGVEEVIIDNESGILVPPGDPAALRVAIRRVLDDPCLASRLTRCASERVEMKFSLGSVAAKMATVYERILDSRRSSWSAGGHRAGTGAGEDVAATPSA